MVPAQLAQARMRWSQHADAENLTLVWPWFSFSRCTHRVGPMSFVVVTQGVSDKDSISRDDTFPAMNDV